MINPKSQILYPKQYQNLNSPKSKVFGISNLELRICLGFGACNLGFNR